jgi:hypothetical protein
MVLKHYTNLPPTKSAKSYRIIYYYHHLDSKDMPSSNSIDTLYKRVMKKESKTKQNKTPIVQDHISRTPWSMTTIYILQSHGVRECRLTFFFLFTQGSLLCRIYHRRLEKWKPHIIVILASWRWKFQKRLKGLRSGYINTYDFLCHFGCDEKLFENKGYSLLIHRTETWDVTSRIKSLCKPQKVQCLLPPGNLRVCLTRPFSMEASS